MIIKYGESKMKVANTAKRSIITALKLKLKYDISSIISILCLIVFSILLSLGTNYSPINAKGLAHDCSIFSYVGFAMQKGRILYTQVWENKGPLLYFIYFVGLSINRNIGIYIIELISIFISVLFSYKTIKVITKDNLYSVLGVIYAFTVYIVTFEMGTLSENFALPFICIGMYLFSKYMLKEKELSNFEIIVFGILSGLIALLRLNMLAIFLAMFLVIGIKLIIEKNFKEIFRWIGLGFLGAIISILPSFIYLIKNGALVECINTVYLNVLSGFNTGTVIDRLKALEKMLKIINISGCVFITLAVLIVLSLLILCKKIKRKNDKFYILSIIIAFVINLYANSVSGAVHMHYFTTFIPIIVMIIGLGIKLLDQININKNLKDIIITVIIVILSFDVYILYTGLCKKRMNPISNNSLNTIIREYIKDNTNETDFVQLIGGQVESVSANFTTQRLSASKYSYLPLWKTFTKERKASMTNELVEDIKANPPKLIFICKYNNNEEEFNELVQDKEAWNEFIKNNYNEDTKTLEKYYVIYSRK